MSWWVADLLRNDQHVLLISWVFWVLLSITLHELGHGVAATWQGDPTPVKSGHMTMNPIVHMGGMSLLVFALVGIAWGAMPVSPFRFRHGRLGDVLVSAAGPAVNLLLAFLALTGLALWMKYLNSGSPFANNVETFLKIGGVLNLILLMLNLIPLPPLDGSRILGGLMPAIGQYFERDEVARYAVFGLLAVIYFGSAHLFAWSYMVVGVWIGFLGTILP